ncbi:putative bifunctional diguanylate cyclase/phosphodiesterase [Bradyrhizobium sp. DOA9]|uniref:putative bifunctional diguanylate cyclase/phosphodiesterase n=1 Tax=Bradyrhizobium sp. DOA9 TaxID=1126627 RepID=UPI00046823B8|nr:EAL domain-containing protein [Bradyrhizobium sp. DOA9]
MTETTIDLDIANVDMNNGFSASCDPRRSRQPASAETDRQRKAEVNWKQLLQTAIESSAHGLCVFDDRSRLVIGNEQHRSLYSLASSEISPGRPVEDVLTVRHARVVGANARGQLADYLAAIRRGEEFQTTYELQDGSFVELDMHPMSDGGFVERHRNVTELRLAEVRAEKARQELIEKQYAIDQAVIVAITDVRGTITYANDRFCEISGYTREELVGNNHRLLKSGVHSPDIFRQMYRRLARGGVWRGELCNRAKNGDLYWVDTVITPQLGPEGKPVAYMAIRVDITARKKAEAQLSHAARHDALTGLLNRAALLDGLSEWLSQAQSKQQTLIVYLLDLDGFKHVNDTLGHAAGDGLLKQLSGRLISVVPATALIARLGGDEFAIVQISAEDAREETQALSVDLLQTIAIPFSLESQEASVGVSIGISIAPLHGLTAPELLYKADLALYRVKSEGRSGFHVFEDEMRSRAQSRNRLVNELRASVGRGEFELHYQPICGAGSLRPRSAEALVRWRHPTRGLLYPDEFIGVAEETGLMEALGRWTLERACADAVAWPGEIKVAVNLSPSQFRGGFLFDSVFGVLMKTGLPAHRLELEVTESMLLQDEEENLRLFRQLKSIGVSFALDDFGIGYASLGSVVAFPFDKLKVDRSFTSELPSKRASRAVVASIMTLARGLNVQVTAEGVETMEQLQYLRSQGVDFVQGYLLGRPVPSGALDLAGVPLHSALSDAGCFEG